VRPSGTPAAERWSREPGSEVQRQDSRGLKPAAQKIATLDVRDDERRRAGG
jgi:hypothetical protein